MSERTPENPRNSTQEFTHPKDETGGNHAVARPVNTGTATAEPATAEPEVVYCVNHPTVETLLRCNRCGRPICLKCAELTDVGYRCKECIRGVQDKYFTAMPMDNFIALGVALAVTAVVAPVLGLLLRMFWLFGWILAFMLGGAAGGILVQIIRAAVSKRRGRHTRHFAVAGVVLGVFVGSFVGSIILGVSPIALIFNIPLLIFTFLAGATANRLLR